MSRESMVFVFFVYGLSFFSLGVAVLLQYRSESRFEFNKALPLLGMFGLVHGVLELNDMFNTLAALGVSPVPGRWLQLLSAVLLPASYVCLLAFGTTALASLDSRYSLLRKKGLWGYLAASALVVAALTPSGKEAGDWLINAKPFFRYFWGAPACALAAASFFLARKSTFITSIGGNISTSLVGLSAAFVAYLLVSGVVVEPNGTFIGKAINANVFQSAFGVPVQLFRAACALGAAYFIVVALRVFELEIQGTLRKERDEVLTGKRQIQNLLDNLGQGFLAFDRAGKVQEGASKAATTFFGTNPEGKGFADVLPIPSPDKDFLGSKWYEMVWTGALAFDDLAPLAPSSFERDGRYIELEYRPIYADQAKESIERVICIASDKTKEKELREKAEAETALVKMVITMLRDRSGFVDFVFEARRVFDELESELAKASPGMDALFRGMHSIKGGTAAFHIAKVSKMAHFFEDQLAELKVKGDGELRKFLPALKEGTSALRKEFETFLTENEYIVGKLDQDEDRTRVISVKALHNMCQVILKHVGKESPAFRFFNEWFVQEDLAQSFTKYDSVVRGIGERQMKSIALSVETGKVRVCIEPYQALLGTYIHAFRNAVDHGIEMPDERVAQGKAEHGTIKVNFSQTTGASHEKNLLIVVEDDGRGIDPEVVSRKAVEKKLITEQQAKSMTENEIANLVFESGFSTSETVSDLSGRGVGLDALRFEAKKLGGRAWIESKKGQGTKVFLEVPLYDTLFIQQARTSVKAA